MGEIHGDDDDAQRDSASAAEDQGRRRPLLQPLVGSDLPRRERGHGREHDGVVDELDHRIDGSCRLVAEVEHEAGGDTTIDEREHAHDASEGDRECEPPECVPQGPRGMLGGLHDSATEEENADHQGNVGKEGHAVGTAGEPVKCLVGRVGIQCRRDGDRQRGLGDVALGPDRAARSADSGRAAT